MCGEVRRQLAGLFSFHLVRTQGKNDCKEGDRGKQHPSTTTKPNKDTWKYQKSRTCHPLGTVQQTTRKLRRWAVLQSACKTQRIEKAFLEKKLPRVPVPAAIDTKGRHSLKCALPKHQQMAKQFLNAANARAVCLAQGKWALLPMSNFNVEMYLFRRAHHWNSL